MFVLYRITNKLMERDNNLINTRDVNGTTTYLYDIVAETSSFADNRVRDNLYYTNQPR